MTKLLPDVSNRALCGKNKMLLEFEKKVADFTRANGLFGSGGKVLIAVSGGADSTALLYAMRALQSEGVVDGELLCAHINHQLRPAESDKDEAFVVEQAGRLSIAVTTRRLDVRSFARSKKLSIETAARELRIESLLEIAGENDCGLIATGHHKNDNAETIVQRLARGTGFRGLCGIWPMREFIRDAFCGKQADGGSCGEFMFVRPMLGVGRDEIIEYLRERNLKWRDDHTNADCAYRRNYIRHRLLPALQRDCRGSVVEQLSELAGSARKFHRLVCSRAGQAWGRSANCAQEEISLDLEGFAGEPEPVKVELIRRGLAGIGSGERDLTQGHYEGILRLAQEDVGGRRIELPGGFVVRREYGRLIFAGPERDRGDERTGEVVEPAVPGQTRFGRYLIEASIFEAEKKHIERFEVVSRSGGGGFVEWFDLDEVKLPIVVRFRRDGDRFVPLGLAGEKKVGKFMTASRVPQSVREKAIIVADSEKIIWVWPVRMSEPVKITDKTRKILQLQIRSV